MGLEQQRHFKKLFNDNIFYFSEDLSFSHYDHEKTGVPMVVFVVAGFNAQGKVGSFAFNFKAKYSTFSKDDVVFVRSRGQRSSNQSLELNYFCGGRIIRELNK
jgi:hypothetical protein